MNIRRSVVFAAALCALLGMAARDIAAEAERVYERVSPSVVLISDFEGFGSGIVMDETGLILTNFHVVSTPLDISVTADVHRPGGRGRHTFKEVELVGVHPTLDMALIQVKDVGAWRFTPISFQRRTSARTGETCYVIGNPAGAEGALVNSITAGMVSAAERRLDGQSYIQISAPINPGNSGGPLVDREGHLLGVVTFKIEQAEGLGFAIDFQKVSRDDFGPLARRENDLEKGVLYEQQGMRFYEAAQRTPPGERRDMLMSLAYAFFRLSMAEMPNAHTPYNNIGVVYNQLGEYETAIAFLKKSIEINPHSITAMHGLGTAYRNTGDSETSTKYNLMGMESTIQSDADRSAKAGCADHYGIDMIKAQRYAEAVYATKWALYIDDAPGRRGSRNAAIMEGIGHLSDAQFIMINEKKDGFSVEDMRRFAAMPADRRPDQVAIDPGNWPMNWQRRIGDVTRGAPRLGAEGRRIELQAAPWDARPAYGGAYLLVHMKEEKRLGLFNVARAEFERFLDLKEDDIVYAAGGANLLIYYPEANEFSTYQLPDFRLIDSRISRFFGSISDMEMALNNPRRAMVSFVAGTEALDLRYYAIMNLETFKYEYIRTGNMIRNNRFRDNVHMRIDNDFEKILLWNTSSSPTGFIYAEIKEDGVEQAIYEHKRYGSLWLLHGGRYVAGSDGYLLDTEGKIVRQYQGWGVFPVQGTEAIVTIKDRDVVFRNADTDAVLGELKIPFDYKNTQWNTNNFTDDRRVYASTLTNRITIIDHNTPNIYVYELPF